MIRVIAVISALFTVACFDVLYGPAYDLERERISRDNHAFPVDRAAHDNMDCNATASSRPSPASPASAAKTTSRP